ncbi:DUF2905 domain-containing protein [Nitrospira sp. Kam-Ns4a]
MAEWSGLGKALIALGALIALVGALLLLAAKLPTLGGGLGWLGRLPGDIFIKRDNFTFYFPLTTSLLISVIVSLFVYLLSRR